MKGIVFTEFLEMVETRFSPAMADDIVASADLPSKGAYTSVGTYQHGEMTRLVAELASRSGIAAPDLLKLYGRHLFARFVDQYPELIEGSADSFGFLQRIEQVVHAEVRKLYPDAELPSFETFLEAAGRLTMIYRSPRCLGDLAEGLMTGCFAHFREDIELARSDVDGGRIVRFALTRPPR